MAALARFHLVVADALPCAQGNQVDILREICAGRRQGVHSGGMMPVGELHDQSACQVMQ